MADGKIDASLALRSEGRLLVGRDRVKLLEAVAAHGSITKAAKAVGFSYKAAWDAVNAINNLLPTPAFVTKAGGRSGGGAEVTEEGRRLIATFHRLEEKLARISETIAEEGLAGAEDFLLWTAGMTISARNVFRAEVTQVRKWPVDVEVTLRVSEKDTILAIVTNDSAERLRLSKGRKALALIKASFVSLAPAGDAAPLQRNCFRGVVTQRVDAERNSEILLDVGFGKTRTAVTPRHHVEDMGLKEGDAALATFDASDVILAVD
jgi:molybdate transport system regulatory protein